MMQLFPIACALPSDILMFAVGQSLTQALQPVHRALSILMLCFFILLSFACIGAILLRIFCGGNALLTALILCFGFCPDKRRADD